MVKSKSSYKIWGTKGMLRLNDNFNFTVSQKTIEDCMNGNKIAKEEVIDALKVLKKFYQQQLEDKVRFMTELTEALPSGHQYINTLDALDAPEGHFSNMTEYKRQCSAFRSIIIVTEETIKKLEKNAFGRCVCCHKSISTARLQIIPWANTCPECASTAHH